MTYYICMTHMYMYTHTRTRTAPGAGERPSQESDNNVLTAVSPNKEAADAHHHDMELESA